MTTIRSTSVWDEPAIEAFLRDTVIPIRLACIDDDGEPLVCSLWFLYDDGELWCATQRSSTVVEFVENNPDVGFEVAPDEMPYRGVRGQGRVTVSHEDGEEALLRLIDRYIGTRDSDFVRWLLERADTEVALKVDPTWVTSWDFSDRMPSSGKD